MAQLFTLENLEKFYTSHPDSIVFAHLASHILAEGDYQRAIQMCRDGLSKHPEYAFGHFVLGSAHYAMKDFNDAKREIEISLAYLPENPKAWKLLSDIHERLNLEVLAKESYLKFYLTDPFNEKAAEKIFREEYLDLTLPKHEITPDQAPEKPTEESEQTERELSEEEMDQLIETAVSSSEDEEDSGDTLDQVFDETVAGAAPPHREKESVDEKQDFEAPEGEEKQGPAGPLADDEISDTMNSYLPDSEEGEGDDKDEGVQDEEEEREPEKTQQEKEQTAETKRDETPAEREFPEEFVEEEPIDFTAVVADLISDRKKDQGDEEIGTEDSQSPAENERDTANEHPSGTIPSTCRPEGERDEKEMETGREGRQKFDESRIEEQPEHTAQFGKPPILSPTLGEIYIAQGRFSEAIDVFKKLLEKDPENSRYRRKIGDLNTIIEKQKSRKQGN